MMTEFEDISEELSAARNAVSDTGYRFCLLLRTNPAEAARVRELLVDVDDALDALHEAAIVRGDL